MPSGGGTRPGGSWDTKSLRVPALVFAVNKLDAVEDADLAFFHIRAALEQFAAEAA